MKHKHSLLLRESSQDFVPADDTQTMPLIVYEMIFMVCNPVCIRKALDSDLGLTRLSFIPLHPPGKCCPK
jgi:hypothetical protein